MSDFDFLMGAWKVRNRKLRTRLKGANDWFEFDATHAGRPLLDGLGNEDEFRSNHDGAFIGMSFRFFNPITKKWAIYWADNRRGVLDPPVYGSFDGDHARFEGEDTFEGRPILVRFDWTQVHSASPRWEQAFSDDGGKTWESNWVMEFSR